MINSVNYNERFYKMNNENINIVETNYVYINDLVLFEDGSTREKDQRSEIQPPPLDPVKRCGLIVKYFSVKLSLAIQEFDIRKRKYLGPARQQLATAGNPGGPPFEIEEVSQELNKLKEKVLHYREKLQAAQQDLEASKASKQVSGLEQQNRNLVGEFIKQVSSIEI